MFTGMCVDTGRCSLVCVWTHVDVTGMCVDTSRCSLVCVWTQVDVHWYVCGHK